MSHPTHNELLDLHFGELTGDRREASTTHVLGCPACRAVLGELEWLENAIAPGSAEAPPADGLARVLARVEGLRPARARRAHGLRAVGPGLAAILGGAAAAHLGGFTAALALVAAGTLATLALAPVLILESQRRSS